MNTDVMELSGNEVKTMTSLEIAALTGKEHKHVLRDIRVMLDSLEIAETSFGLSYKDSTGRTNTMFELPKVLTITLVAGYSAPLRHSIIQRWEELESAAKGGVSNFVIPTTLSAALRLAADENEKKEQALLQLSYAKQEIAEAQPMIDFHSAVVADDKVYGLSQAAKILGIAPQKFNTYLRDEKYLMRNLVPYERWIKQGVFESGFAGFVRPDGTTAPATTYVSSKVLAYLQKKLAE